MTERMTRSAPDARRARPRALRSTIPGRPVRLVGVVLVLVLLGACGGGGGADAVCVWGESAWNDCHWDE